MLDLAFNEEISKVQSLELTNGKTLMAYSLTDLIAEKYWALLQQTQRKRNRRQDVYDLDILIRIPRTNTTAILDSIIQKCQSRDIIPTSDSITDSEIGRRASSEWNSLELEVSNLADFNACFKHVVAFYRKLPWPE